MLGSPGHASQCLPTGQFTDLSTGSAVRSDHDYFQRLGSLVTSQDNLQCHNATLPLTTSHLLRLYPQISHSSAPDPRDIRRLQHRLYHLSIQAGGASQDSRVRAKSVFSLKQASPVSLPPPHPSQASTSKFAAGVFKPLPFLGVVFNALRQMREVFTHRSQ